jgi:hypothetical protein
MADRIAFASAVLIAAVKSERACCNICVGENEDAF